jgi:hypothetical protein
MSSNYYVYSHILDNEDKPFYIGKGKGNRAHDIKCRSEFWQRKARGGYRVEIIKENLSESEALELEKELIALYGRRDKKTGCLVNLTDGGDGLINPSKEVREKIGNANKERFKDPGFREKFSLSQKNKIISKKTREKMRDYRLSIHDKEKHKLLDMAKKYHIDRKTKLMSSENPYVLISPDGIEHTCYYQSDFAKQHGLKLKSLNNLLLGRRKSLYGWKLK